MISVTHVTYMDNGMRRVWASPDPYNRGSIESYGIVLPIVNRSPDGFSPNVFIIPWHRIIACEGVETYDG